MDLTLSPEAQEHIRKKGGRAVVDLIWCSS
jgi:hypothetical protein